MKKFRNPIESRSRIDLRHATQDVLADVVAAKVNYLDEASLEDEVPEGFSEDELKMEIKKQAKQILRRIGYTSMPGVFDEHT